jgi:hypothetical protein
MRLRIVRVILDEISRIVEEQIAWCLKHGVTKVTVRGFKDRNGAFHVNAVLAPDEEILWYAQLLKDAGIEVVCFASPLGKMDVKPGLGFGAPWLPYQPLEQYQAGHLSRSIEVAGIFEAGEIRVFTMYGKPGDPENEALAQPYLKLTIEVCTASNLRVVVENEANLVFARPTEILSAVLSLNLPGYGAGDRFLAFDSANLQCIGCNAAEIAAEWEATKQSVYTYHAKELKMGDQKPVLVDGRVNEKNIKGFCVVGDGDGGAGDIVRYIGSDEGDGIVIDMEPHMLMEEGDDTQYGGTSGPENTLAAYSRVKWLLAA